VAATNTHYLPNAVDGAPVLRPEFQGLEVCSNHSEYFVLIDGFPIATRLMRFLVSINVRMWITASGLRGPYISKRVRCFRRLIPSEGIWLAGLGHVWIHT
jgi:hypothetical protein